MTTSQQYTPLESFLLFQSLRNDLNRETGLPSFSQISVVLKENEYVKTNSTFEPGRLEPDSLKNLYLEQMKEEARQEKSRSTSPSRDGDANPRKRKLSTPPPEFINDAATQKHLLPKIITRLYIRYKDYVTKIIEEDERKYQQLQRDIQEIERGEWDARLQAPDYGPRRESKGVSSIQTLLRDDSEDPARDTITSRDRSEAQKSQTGASHAQDSTPYTEVNGYVQHSNASNELTPRARAPSLSGSLNAHSPTNDSYPALPRPSSHLRTDSHGTYLPPIGSAAHSPTMDVNRRLPPPPQMTAPSLTSPRLPNSPIILPPPPGMIRSSGSPAGPLDALADIAGQQYRPNQNAQSPRQSQYYSSQSHPNQLPQPRNYMQRSYPYYDSQVPYAQHYPPYAQNPLPPYQSPNSSQFQPPANTPQQFWSGPRQNGTAPYQSPLPSYSQYSGYHPSPSGYQSNTQASRLLTGQSPDAPMQATPLPLSDGRRRAQKLSPIDTSVSSTKWKRVSLSGARAIPGSPSPPGPEGISPISDGAPSPGADVFESGERKSRIQDAGKGLYENMGLGIESTPTKDTRAVKQRGRAGRSRGQSARGRGARAASTASSVPAGSGLTRTRSQSLVSHGDEASGVKPEPATPAAVLDDSISTSRGEAPRTSGRARRDTLRSLEVPPTISRAGVKRKRAGTLEGTPDPPSPITNFRPNQVLASRNFPRTSATIMNDISTHKLAAMFAKPLTQREAPGYKDLIYRPQDLKSIKSAISAGSRALAALDDAGSPSAGANKSTATLWVDKGPDVVPPKGIVNSAQLEKEVCRIFVNAVMYNTDPKHGLGPAYRTRAKAAGHIADSDDEADGNMEEDDGGGVVRDTREMFESVEKSLSNWRAAERTVDDGRVRPKGGGDAREEESMDELAVLPVDEIIAEDHGGGTVKKRRRA